MSFYGGDVADTTLAEREEKLLELLSAEYTPSELLSLDCLPGTRTTQIAKIREWFDNDAKPNVFLLLGGPGTGKTRIAWDTSAELERQQRNSSEMFLRPGAHTPEQVWRTIAYKLARYHPMFRTTISRILHQDDVSLSDVADTFQKLIVGPLNAAADSFRGRGHVVVIDGLDQCSQRYAEDWDALLKTIASWSSELPAHFKLVVTTRPQADILKAFQDAPVERLELLTGERCSDEDNADIKRFLTHRLTELTKERFKDSPIAWPPPRSMSKLVKECAGFFFWADAVAEYIGHAPDPDPDRQLVNAVAGGASAKYEAVDNLYRDLLHEVFPDSPPPGFRLTMGAISVAKARLTLTNLQSFFRNHENYSSAELCERLLPFIAIEDENGELSLRHRSFAHYLMDPKRCTEEYAIDKTRANRDLAMGCLRIMQNELKFNICDVQTSYTSGSEVPSSTIQSCISSELSYASRFWADHIQLASDQRDAELLGLVKDFFTQSRFLYWIEVLSVLACVDAAARHLVLVAEWLEANGEKELCLLVHDVSHFVATSRDAIAFSPAHIYLSALAFCLPTSRVYKQCHSLFPNHLSPLRRDGIQRPSLRFVIATEGIAVHALALSPDGKRLAAGVGEAVHVFEASNGTHLFTLGEDMGTVRALSFAGKRIVAGSDAGTIRVWDSDTGNQLGETFKAHTDWIRGVAISPDGTQLASGSDDRTVRVVDLGTMQSSISPSEGHNDYIRSVAWTPDGRFVISASDDRTLRVWDKSTGLAVGNPFVGHQGYVRTVTVELSKGELAASGGDDENVYLWDLESRTQLRTLRGHSSTVRALAFSSDGLRLFSGSDDYSITIWDVATGRPLVEPLQEHTSPVSSIFANAVAYYPTNTYLVSGADDGTLCIWNTITGMASAPPFQAHEGSVFALDVTPDGLCIVSAGEDKTIRLWDAISREALLSPLIGHTGPIHTVHLSSDGSQIISGSRDGSIRIWDRESCEPVCPPLYGQDDEVLAVAVSPDGKRVISGGADKTVSVWSIDLSRGMRWPAVSERELRGFAVCTVDEQGTFVDGVKFHDGWVYNTRGDSDERKLFWVPPPYRKGLFLPRVLGVFGTSETVIDMRKFVHGTEWSRCKA
ncbi:hypothetical protein OF83DRAFT_1064690 [Amylostereum chailletii]|nr:hypothetical protein OF83DRAFT_1064690 [Amylostereum chailletii]